LIVQPASDVQRDLDEIRAEIKNQKILLSSLLETVSRQAATIAHLENQLHGVTDRPLEPSSQPDAVPGYSNDSQASAGESGDNQSLVWFVFTYKELKISF